MRVHLSAVWNTVSKVVSEVLRQGLHGLLNESYYLGQVLSLFVCLIRDQAKV